MPVVAPRPWVTGRLVGVSVYLSAVIRDPAHYKDHLRRYLSVGAAVMRGCGPWAPQPRLPETQGVPVLAHSLDSFAVAEVAAGELGPPPRIEPAHDMPVMTPGL